MGVDYEGFSFRHRADVMTAKHFHPTRVPMLENQGFKRLAKRDQQGRSSGGLLG